MTYDEKVNEAMKLCANGNSDAWNYLAIISQSARLVDDLYDEIMSWTGVKTCALAQLLLVDLPANSFFHANKVTLLPLHVTSLNAWMDSNEWIKEDKVKKNYALVIRDQLTELALMVAFLTGGSEHLRKISLKVRELFLKEEF